MEGDIRHIFAIDGARYDRFDDVSRAALHLGISFSQILAQHADTENLNPAQKVHGQHR